MPARMCTVSPSNINPHNMSILTHPVAFPPDFEQTPPPNYRPEIPITLFNKSHNALLDSGATVSAISEDLFKILNQNSDPNTIPLFPLTGIFLNTALSHKTIKIKSQIYLNFHVQNYKTHGIFLVVPQLSTPLILGTDWLLENGVTIDYNSKEISLPSIEDNIPFKLTQDNDPNSLVNSLKNIIVTNDPSTMYEGPSHLINQTYPFETEKNIALNEIPLNDSQHQLMTSLLQKYDHIFKDNPIDTLSRHPLGRDDQPPKDSPSILHYTLPPPIPPDIISIFNNISSEQQKERLNPTFFKINDLVLARTHKLSNKIDKKISKFFLLYDGPFKVKNIKNVNAYELVNPDDDTPHGTYNVNQLKPYIPPVT